MTSRLAKPRKEDTPSMIILSGAGRALMVAACSLALGLGALATADAAHAQPHASAPGSMPRAAVTAGPDIQEQPCIPARATWVHLTMVTASGQVTRCYGFAGTEFFPANKTVRFCSGNNFGTLRYLQGGLETVLIFRPGATASWPAGVNVVSLTITQWSGTFSCPLTG